MRLNDFYIPSVSTNSQRANLCYSNSIFADWLPYQEVGRPHTQWRLKMGTASWALTRLWRLWQRPTKGRSQPCPRPTSSSWYQHSSVHKEKTGQLLARPDLPWHINTIRYAVCMHPHNSPIYDECQTQSAQVLALPWKRAHQGFLLTACLVIE